MAIKQLDTVLDAQRAQELADLYLIDSVGDLLQTGQPRLENHCWRLPIVLSNARRGPCGEVGIISVHAVTGEVQFSDEERSRVKASVRRLAGASSP